MQTHYITLDEIRQYFPSLDLVQELGSEEEAIAYVKRIEDRLELWIDTNFNRRVEDLYGVFTDYQKKHYKLALLEQVEYIHRNADVGVDAGYDSEKGQVIDRAKLKELAVAPYAYDHLYACGLIDRDLGRNYHFGFPWWF